MTPSPRISVVLPVFNEDRNIATCLRRLHAALAQHDHEILVCYDFDEDTTLGAIAAMGDCPPTMRLVRNRLGRGAANALRAGFAAATGDVIVTTMADLSDPPERIPDLARAMRDHRAAIVAGSRYMPGGSQTGGPFLKKTLSRVAGLALHTVAGVATHDATNNFKAYSREFLGSVTIESNTAFDIALELTVKAHLRRETIVEVPSSWTDRSEGKSNFRMWKWLPNYLRWFWKGMTLPLAIWGIVVAGCVLGAALETWGAGNACVNWTFSGLHALAATGFILWSRRLSGRMSALDVLHAAIWQLPFHAQGAQAHLGAEFWAITGESIGASLLVVGISCGFGALWRSVRGMIARITQAGVLLALLAVLLLLSRLQINEVAKELGLDSSWQLAYPYFFQRGLQAGVDYIFTYGPLGFLEQGAYSAPAFFQQFYFWGVLVRGLLAIALVLVTPRLDGALAKAAWVLLIFGVPLGEDSYLFVCIAAIAVLLLHRERPSFPWTILAFFLFAVIGASKFTYFMQAAGCAALVALDFARRRSLVAGALALAAFGVAFLVTWMCAGQNPLNLPRFFQASLEISNGYSESMSSKVPPERLHLALWSFAGMAALMLCSLLAPPRRLNRLLAALAVAGSLFVAFKGGFTRQEGSITFFGMAIVAPYLILPAPGGGALARWGGSLLRLAVALVGIASLPEGRGMAFERLTSPIANALGRVDLGAFYLRFPNEVQNLRTATEKEAMAKMELPRIKQLVGSGSVDYFGMFQQHVLWSGLDYRPRPIFQSYSAYTSWLLRQNAEFYSGPRAPDFVLFSPDAIDHAFPPMFEGPSIRALLRNYTAVTFADDQLLLRRNDAQVGADSVPRKVVFDERVALGRRFDVDAVHGDCLVAFVTIGLTTKGHVLKTVYQVPPVLTIRVEQENAKPQTYTLGRAQIAAGFILRPYLLGSLEYLRWMYGGRIDRVLGITIDVEDDYRDEFEPDFRLKIVEADDLVPHYPPELVRTLRYPMLRTVPDEYRGDAVATLAAMDGENVLLTHAPSYLSYVMKEAGTYRVDARFGILPTAYTGDAHTDGVTFRVGRVVPGATDGDEAFQRTLDPLNVAADRGLQSLSVTITAAAGDKIVLAAGVGPKGDGGYDWSVWTDVEVTRLPDAAPGGR